MGYSECWSKTIHPNINDNEINNIAVVHDTADQELNTTDNVAFQNVVIESLGKQ